MSAAGVAPSVLLPGDVLRVGSIGLLTRLRFRVTVNTDNRLMSGCTMTSEFAALHEAFGYDLADYQWFTINAMKSAFLDFDARLALINDVIKPGYAALGVGGRA